MSKVFTVEPLTANAIPMPHPNSYGLFDPALLRAAKEMYTIYCELDADREKRRQPIGIAINTRTHRGKLIFSSYPILLPEECFIPTQQLEVDIN